MNNINNLKPFPRFCVTLGMLPTSYKESMTYEEQLLWLCNYIENEIIPKYNENVKAINELITLYNQLKEYVDNYFDNLDVQQEIDNKLDDMAESGQLAEIITAYLEVNGVLAFDNITALEGADNVINGSVAYIIGEVNYNDGKGAFYKIRTKLETDVIDHFNIVETTDETLVGERLPNYYINSIESNINNIETDIEDIKKELDSNNLYLGAFFNANEGNKIYLKVSKDGKKFVTLPISANITGRDPSIVYFRNKFYIAVTNYSNTFDFIIYTSEDLVNFETHVIDAELNNYYDRWAPELYVENNQLKIFISLRETANSNFNIYSLDCTNINNLTFGNLTNITPSQETSCIDANIVKYNNGYYMVVTDVTDVANDVEISKIYYSTDLSNWSVINSNIFKTCYNVEGCQLINLNGKWSIYGDSPLLTPYLLIQTDNLANTDREGNNISDYIQPLRSLTDMRHGTILYVTDSKIKNIIYDLINDNDFNIDYDEPENKITILTSIENQTLSKLLVQPNTVIHVGGASNTITKLYNPFRVDKIGIVFFTSVDYGEINFTQIQNNQGTTNTVNINYHDSSNIHEKMFYQSLEQNCNKTYIPKVLDLLVNLCYNCFR